MSFFDENSSNVITGHIAWHGTLNRFMSELFLHSHKPKSYILWHSEQESYYFFSHVVKLFTISHTLFLLDPITLLWKYTYEETIYQDKNIDQILQSIMQKYGQGNWQPIVHPSKRAIYLSKQVFFS